MRLRFCGRWKAAEKFEETKRTAGVTAVRRLSKTLCWKDRKHLWSEGLAEFSRQQAGKKLESSKFQDMCLEF